MLYVALQQRMKLMADIQKPDNAEQAFEKASSDAGAKTPAATKANAAPKSAAKPAAEAKASTAKPAAKTPAAKTNVSKAKPAAKAKSPKAKAKPVARRAVAKKTTSKTRRTTAKASPAQKGQPVMTDTVKKLTATAKKVGEDTKARVETLVADASAKTRDAMEKSTKAAQEVTAFSKGNVEAIVESGKITAAGLKSIGEDSLEFSRKSFEDATGIAKKYAAVKTPAELFQLHGDYVRSSFDTMVAQASKNSEAMVKLAGESFQPISSRFAEAATKIKTAA